MTNDWAPEPWTFRPEDWFEDDGKQYENEIIAADKSCVASDMQFYPHVDADSMHRIVACVNACAGVPTEILNDVDKNITHATNGRELTLRLKPFKEATGGHDNIGPPAHDNFRWFPDPEDL